MPSFDAGGRRRPDRPPAWRLALFSAPALPIAALALPLTVYLPNYYASEIGIPLAVVAAAFAWVRLVDMMFDPLFGGVLDRTRTALGRFRPWLTFGGLGMMAATYMLFMVKPGAGVGYLWMGLIALYGFYSIATLSHVAWGAALTPDYDGRSTIYAWQQAAGVAGAIVVLALPPLVERLAHGDHGAGVRAMGWLIILSTPVTILMAVLGIGETAAPVAHRAETTRASLGQYFALFRNGSVRRILFADLLFGLPPAITGALFFFFFEQVKHVARAEAGFLLLFYFVGALCGSPVWTALARRINKHRALALAGLIYVVTQTSTLVTPNTSFALGALVLFLAGLPFSASTLLLRSMMADVGDEVRLEGGRDRTGLLYALLVGTLKVCSASAVFISFTALGAFGFDPKAGAVNSADAIMGLKVMFVAVPVTLSVLGVLVVRGFRLTPARHAEVRAKLDARDALEAGLVLAPQALMGGVGQDVASSNAA